MADQARFIIEQGTPVVWGQPSASGVTKDLSLNNLAAAAARMGVVQDLGSQWDTEYILEARMESGTAPTAGGTVDVYLAWSTDNTNWPAGVSGADGAFTVANVNQLGAPAVSVVAVNSANTIQRQNPVIVRPRARYVVPVVINNWSQGLRNETTATDNDSRVILTPRILKAIDP